MGNPEQDEPVSITDWFDEEDPVHAQAWKELCHKGTWPLEFIPYEYVTFPPAWQAVIAIRMAEKYVHLKVAEHEKATIGPTAPLS